jgi:cell division protein FtsX
MENGVWFSFFCTVFAVGICLHLFSNVFTALPYQLLFIFTGLFTTFLNLGAAHSTYFMKQNFVTEKLLQNREVRI